MYFPTCRRVYIDAVQVAGSHKQLEFTLNGQARSSELTTSLMLLNLFARNLISSRRRTVAAIGAMRVFCAVMVEGKVVALVRRQAKTVAERKVKTLEGLPSEERDLIARDLSRRAGPAMRVLHSRDCDGARNGCSIRIPRCPEEINAGSDRIVRCTGYTKIVDAVNLPAKSAAAGISGA